KRLILSWGTPWDMPWYPEGHIVGDCVITYKKERIREAGSVLFHYTALDKEEMPWKHYRAPDQYFVFWSLESPAFIQNGGNRDMKKFDGGFINWTMTYRLDADIFAPFLQPSEANRIFFGRGKSYVDQIMRKKNKMALWNVNNCNISTGSVKRMKYVNSLIKAGLSVSQFGHCFGNQAENSKLHPDEMESYKFYLAFENAKDCRYYVTEKFWRSSLHYGRVPVVWGTSRSDLSKLAPRWSFIHTDDFRSPSDLAEYLLYLDKNDSAYREYFSWMENPTESDKKFASLYQRSREEALCHKLQSDPQSKVIESVSKYLFMSESSTC
uniref:Fucosyltransferase n=1 Tax=Ciona savignyi TaxID=51511 RepID=H2Y538_CIOSA